MTVLDKIKQVLTIDDQIELSEFINAYGNKATLAFKQTISELEFKINSMCEAPLLSWDLKNKGFFYMKSPGNDYVIGKKLIINITHYKNGLYVTELPKNRKVAIEGNLIMIVSRGKVNKFRFVDDDNNTIYLPHSSDYMCLGSMSNIVGMDVKTRDAELETMFKNIVELMSVLNPASYLALSSLEGRVAKAANYAMDKWKENVDQDE